MARIPVYDQQPEAAHGYSNPGPVLESDNPGAAITKGLDQLAGESEQLQGRMDRAHAEAKDKAYAIAQANADAAYQNAETKRLVGGSNRGQLIDNAFNETPGSDAVGPGDVEQTPGFLSSRGIEAAKQSGPVLDDMEQARQQIAKDNFGDEEQRQRWLARSNGMIADTNRKVQAHTAQQFQVAQEDALKGKLSSTIQSIASDTDGSQTERLVESASESIRKLQVSKEGGDAAIAKLQQEALKVRISRLLTDGNLDVAEKQYEIGKDKLGTEVPEVERMIEHAKKTRDQNGKDVAGEQAASKFFTEAVNPKTGWVDANKAESELEKMPANTPAEVGAKDEARQRLGHRLQVANNLKVQAVSSHFNAALSAYQKAGTLGAVSPSDKVWLQDPANKVGESDAWERLRQISRADAEHAKSQPPTIDQQRAMTQFLVDLHDNPDKYAVMPEAQYNLEVVPGLAKSDRERAGAAFAVAHGQTSKPTALTNDETRMLLEAGRAAKLFPEKQNDVSKWEDGQAELYYAATKRLTDWAKAERKRTGKAPSFDEMKKQVDTLTIQGKIPGTGFWGFFQKKQTALEADISGKPFEPTWSEEEKNAARSAAPPGVVVNDSTIDQYLRRKHGLPSLPSRAPQLKGTRTDLPDAPKPGEAPDTPLYGD